MTDRREIYSGRLPTKIVKAKIVVLGLDSGATARQ